MIHAYPSSADPKSPKIPKAKAKACIRLVTSWVVGGKTSHTVRHAKGYANGHALRGIARRRIERRIKGTRMIERGTMERRMAKGPSDRAFIW